MNELLKLKEIERAVDMWWEDDLLFKFFSREIETCYEGVESEMKEMAEVNEKGSLKLAIKKPTGSKGLKAQGYKGRGRAAAFYS